MVYMSIGDALDQGVVDFVRFTFRLASDEIRYDELMRLYRQRFGFSIEPALFKPAEVTPVLRKAFVLLVKNGEYVSLPPAV